MLATRALLTGTFAAPPPSAVALTSSPDGGWTQVIEPRAIHHDGVTYFGFIDGDDGHVKVGAYTHSTGNVDIVQIGDEAVDTHCAPVLCIRADGRLLVWWSGHNGPSMYQRLSTNPLDISSWGDTVDLDTALGAALYTYPSAFRMDDGTIHLFFRDRTAPTTGRLAHSTSTDGGATWATRDWLVQESGHGLYFVMCSDGERIDIAVNSDLGSGLGSVYHLYLEGGGAYLSDGTPISTPISPFDLSLVYDGTSDPGWPSSIFPGPVIAYTVDTGSDVSYRVARYASGWTSATVGAANAALVDPAPSPSLVDADTMYAPVKVGSYFELHRFALAAETETAITSGSSVDNIYPARVHGGTPWKRVVWLRGTYAGAESTNALQIMIGH